MQWAHERPPAAGGPPPASTFHPPARSQAPVGSKVTYAKVVVFKSLVWVWVGLEPPGVWFSPLYVEREVLLGSWYAITSWIQGGWVPLQSDMPSDEKFMPWRTISCHTWQQSLCCPLSQALCSRVMRCEADSTGKVSSHRFLNFSGASAEPYCVKRWDRSVLFVVSDIHRRSRNVYPGWGGTTVLCVQGTASHPFLGVGAWFFF